MLLMPFLIGCPGTKIQGIETVRNYPEPQFRFINMSDDFACLDANNSILFAEWARKMEVYVIQVESLREGE